MKILSNFMMGLYTKISMLKDLWEDFSETKLAAKLASNIKLVDKGSNNQCLFCYLLSFCEMISYFLWLVVGRSPSYCSV